MGLSETILFYVLIGGGVAVAVAVDEGPLTRAGAMGPATRFFGLGEARAVSYCSMRA